MFISHSRSATLIVFSILLLLFHAGAENSVAQQPHTGVKKSAERMQTGSITGTITNPEKKGVNANGPLLATGVFVDLQEFAKAVAYDPGDYQTRGLFGDVENGRSRLSSDRSMGGLYTFSNLRPGVYNLLVEGGVLPDNIHGGYTYYRPQRIVGVVVNPGQETVLNIIMHPGDKLQQSGRPKHNTLEYIGEPKDSLGRKGSVGWIEGAVTNADGQPVLSARGLLASGVVVTFKKTSGEAGSLQTDLLSGGFYSASLLAGTYTVTVEKGGGFGNSYRPLIISGVVIKPGVRTIFNIVLKSGDELERTSAPQMETQPVVVIAKQ